MPVSPEPDSYIRNRTILAAETPQEALSAARRRSVMIQAINADMWVNFFGEAAEHQGFLIVAGQTRVMYFRDWPQIDNALSVWSATEGAYFTVEFAAR